MAGDAQPSGGVGQVLVAPRCWPTARMDYPPERPGVESVGARGDCFCPAATSSLPRMADRHPDMMKVG